MSTEFDIVLHETDCKCKYCTKSAIKREAERVKKEILENMVDLDPEFKKTVDDNFWDLI